ARRRTSEDCAWPQVGGARAGDYELNTERCRPAAAYSFTRLPRSEDRLFTEATCAFSGMAEGLGEDPFRFDANGFNQQEENMMRFSPPPPFSIALPDLEVAITHATRLPSLGATFGALRGIARFSLTSPTPLPLAEWIARFFGPFQNFLTLATGRPNAILHASVV